MIHVDNDWQPLFDEEQVKPYYLELRQFLKSEYYNQKIFPPMGEIFNAFKLTPFHETKVIIVGQDPYHGDGQAMGLSFSVRENIEEPPSLRNIHQEIMNEGVEQGPWSRDLTRWARQGVLLLNSSLTVRAHQAGSHAGRGWEIFTDNAIRALNADDRPKVVMLWGGWAQKKASMITNPHHLILKTSHPSPLSAYRGFIGSNCFNDANSYLKSTGQTPIIW